MASQLFADSRARAYMRAKRILEGSGQYIVNDDEKGRSLKKPVIRVAQSNLVSIIPINSASTNYQLNTLANQPNLGNAGILTMEKRLKLQDVFFTSSLGYFLTVLSQTNAAGTYTNIQFQFFCNPVPSLGGVAGVGDLAALMGIWSLGTLEVKTNGETITPDWWLWNHMVINQTESNFAGAPMNPFWDQQNFPEDGFYVVEPNWILNGGNDNNYTIKYGNTWGNIWAGANAANGNQFAIALVWDGWLAQNASSIMNNAPAK
jgi:hypothetical protein